MAGLLLLAPVLGAAVAPPAFAQRIVAVVNDDVVSDRDVRQRLALALLASGRRATPEAEAQLRDQVIRTLVDDRLKLQEAERLGIVVPDEEIEAAFDRIAASNNVSRDVLMARVATADVDASTLRAQVRAELAWRRVVQRQLMPRVVVSDAQVAQRLEEAAAGEEEYRLAEIFLPIYQPDDAGRVVGDARQLRAAQRDGADFAALARQFSASPSAERGGEIGWVPAGRVPEQLRRLLDQLADGEVSEPIRTQEGVYLFRRLDHRSGGSRLEITLVRLDVADAENVGGDDVAEFAAETAAETRDCAALEESVRDVSGVTVQRLEGLGPQSLEGRLATVALTSPLGVLSEPMRTVEGTTALVMVCERVGGADADQRLQIEQRLQSEALERLAGRYLRNLRREAFIEIRRAEG